MSKINDRDAELKRVDDLIGLKLKDLEKAYYYEGIALSRLKLEEKKWSDIIYSENLELEELSNMKNTLINNLKN